MTEYIWKLIYLAENILIYSNIQIFSIHYHSWSQSFYVTPVADFAGSQ